MTSPAAPVAPNWIGSEGDPLLVGRDSELLRLTNLVAEAVRGSGGVMLIHGEAGIGKTRLLTEISARAAVEGVRCLGGLCQERDQGVPYAPWIEILRQLVKRSSKELLHRVVGESRPAILRLLPELGERVWLHDPGVARPREFQGHEFLDAIARLVLTLSTDQPVLIVLDDLGWADAGTLELLTTLSQDCAGHRIAIVAAYRDAHRESNRPLDRALTEFERARRAIDLCPKPLNRGEVDQLTQSAWAGQVVGRGIRQVVWRRSGGNPFFAVEILRSLADIPDLAGEWESGDAAAELRLGVPAGIRGVISHRLDRLDETTRRALRVASLLGLEFSFELLESVSKMEEEALLSSLEVALQLRLINIARTTPAGSTYAFAHPLIQEVLTAEVGPDRSRRVHLRAARAIEAQAGSGEELAASLAYHYLRANDAPMALRQSVRAGDRAARLCARNDAVAHYRTALALLAEHPDPAVSAQVLHALSQQLTILGDYGGAVKSLVEAAGWEERLGNLSRAGTLMAQAALTVWSPRGFRPQADQLQQARSLLEGASASPELAQLHLDHATLLAKRGRLDEARTQLAQSLDAAKVVGNRSVEAGVHLARALNVARGGRAEVHRELQIALDLIREESPEMVLRSHHLLALFSGYGYADLDESARWVDSADRAIPAAEPPALLAATHGGVGAFITLMRGDLEATRRASEEYREFIRAHGQPESAHNLVLLAALATLSEEFEEAGELLRRARTTFSEEEGWCQDLWLGVVAGQLELARGEPARAVDVFARGLDLLRRRGWIEFDGMVGVFYLAGLVEAHLRTGARDLARSSLGELVPLASLIGGTPAAAFARRAEGQLGEADGRKDAAAECFQESVELWKAAGWRLEWARDLAALSSVTPGEGSLPRSDELRAEAIHLCEQAGSRLDLSRIRAGTYRHGGPALDPASGSIAGPRRKPARKAPGGGEGRRPA